MRQNPASRLQYCDMCGERREPDARYCSACGYPLEGESAPVPDSDPLIGRQVGEYVIEKRLGRGGMATVYRARHPDARQTVAIKLLNPELLRDQNLLERFHREARILAALDHPNIVRLLTAHLNTDIPAIVLEYVDGAPLNEVLEMRAPLPLGDVRRIFTQVLDGLEFAHGMSNPIVHRDIKPSNILVRPDGRVKVTDFGIAKFSDASRLTRTGNAVGTSLYMSPEQITGTEEVDYRSDIYSVGATLFEALTGLPPFRPPRNLSKSEGEFLIREAHVKKRPRDPAEIRDDISPELSAVVLMALEKDPDERFPSCKAFKEALVSALTPPVRSRDQKDKPTASAASAFVADKLSHLPELAALEQWMYRRMCRLMERSGLVQDKGTSRAERRPRSEQSGLTRRSSYRKRNEEGKGR